MPKKRGVEIKIKGYYWLAILFFGFLAVVMMIKAKDWIAQAIAYEQYRTNIIWVTDDKVSWVSISSQDQQMTTLEVPAQMMVPVVGMEGNLRSEVLWKFGEGERQALRITKRSSELLFGAVSDGVVYSNSKDIRRAMWSGKTDLGLGQRWLIYWSLGKINQNQRRVLTIPEEMGLLERMVNNNLANDLVLNSKARIVVLNGSGQKSASRLAERQLKSAGGLVVDVRDDENLDGWCSYKVGQKTLSENQGLINWLKLKMGCVGSKEELNRDGEVEVVVGKKWSEVYSR